MVASGHQYGEVVAALAPVPAPPPAFMNSASSRDRAATLPSVFFPPGTTSSTEEATAVFATGSCLDAADDDDGDDLYEDEGHLPQLGACPVETQKVDRFVSCTLVTNQPVEESSNPHSRIEYYVSEQEFFARHTRFRGRSRLSTLHNREKMGSCRASTQFLPILLKGHERSITTVKYNGDGDLIFTAVKDQTTVV